MKPGHQGAVVPLWCNVTHRPHRNWDRLQVWTNRKQSWVGELWQFFVVCKSEDELFYRQLMFMNPMIIPWIHSHSLAFDIICVFRRSQQAWESTHESRQVMITVYFLQPLCLSDQIVLPDKQTEINQKLKFLVTFKLMFNLWKKAHTACFPHKNQINKYAGAARLKITEKNIQRCTCTSSSL